MTDLSKEKNDIEELQDFSEGKDSKTSEINSEFLLKEQEKKQSKWINNQDNEVEQVFGFNENAELVNSRAAMIGFLMLIITEIVFNGQPVTLSIFGIK